MVLINAEIDADVEKIVPDLGLGTVDEGDYERSRRLRRLIPELPLPLQRIVRRAVHNQRTAGRTRVQAEADVYRGWQLVVAAARSHAAGEQEGRES